MSEYSPSKLASVYGDDPAAEADAAEDALEDDPVTTIGEAPNCPDEQRDKEALSQGLFHLFKPAIDNIDGRVKAVRQSQVELRAHIDNLAEDLRRISDCRVVPIDLEPYIKKLLNSRRRILAVANLLQTVQERVNKVNYYVNRDKSRKRQMIKTSTAKLLDQTKHVGAASVAPSGGAAAASATAEEIGATTTTSEVKKSDAESDATTKSEEDGSSAGQPYRETDGEGTGGGGDDDDDET